MNGQQTYNTIGRKYAGNPAFLKLVHVLHESSPGYSYWSKRGLWQACGFFDYEWFNRYVDFLISRGILIKIPYNKPLDRTQYFFKFYPKRLSDFISFYDITIPTDTDSPLSQEPSVSFSYAPNYTRIEKFRRRKPYGQHDRNNPKNRK